MGELLGFAAAVMFGASHFFNGVLTRQIPAMKVAIYSQAGGAVLFAAWAVTTWDTWPRSDDLIWGGISGLGAGVGVGALYEGMRAYRISVVVPVTSIVSVTVPFLLAILVLGDHVEPLLIVAAVALVPATWLLGRPSTSPKSSTTSPSESSPLRTVTAARRASNPNRAAVGYGLIAGLGYATQLFALSRLSSPEPAMPMLIGQLASFLPLLLLLGLRPIRDTSSGTGSAAGKAALVGGLAALAMVSYLYATREADALAPVMVAIALYPALPVLLALLVLKERLSRLQVTGLAIAAVALPVINIAS